MNFPTPRRTGKFVNNVRDKKLRNEDNKKYGILNLQPQDFRSSNFFPRLVPFIFVAGSWPTHFTTG